MNSQASRSQQNSTQSTPSYTAASATQSKVPNPNSFNLSTDALKTGFDQVGNFLKEQPYVTLGVAAIVGYFAASLFFPTPKTTHRSARH